MSWEAVKEGVVTFIVLFVLIFLVYTAMRKQSLRDTWDEIVELFTSKPEITEDMYYG